MSKYSSEFHEKKLSKDNYNKPIKSSPEFSVFIGPLGKNAYSLNQLVDQYKQIGDTATANLYESLKQTEAEAIKESDPEKRKDLFLGFMDKNMTKNSPATIQLRSFFESLNSAQQEEERQLGQEWKNLYAKWKEKHSGQESSPDKI